MAKGQLFDSLSIIVHLVTASDSDAAQYKMQDGTYCNSSNEAGLRVPGYVGGPRLRSRTLSHSQIKMIVRAGDLT